MRSDSRSFQDPGGTLPGVLVPSSDSDSSSGSESRGARARIAVVGGGIGGLAGAHYLERAGHEVHLFESSDRLGGVATWFAHEEFDLDCFYHVLLPTDVHLLALLADVGLSSSAYWRPTTLGIVHGGRSYPLSSPRDLLRYRPLPFVDRLRLGWTALRAARHGHPEELDAMTVEEWLTRLSGRRAFDHFWRPLLEAKFGDAYRRVPALWYWSRLRRDRSTKGETKGYLRGGYKGIAEVLASSLRMRGATISLRSPVEALGLDVDGRPTLKVNGDTRTFDQVLSTVPMPALVRMARGGALEALTSHADADVDYQGVCNVVLLLRRSLMDHYWAPVVDSGMPFQGIVETTRVVDRSQTGGHHLVYLLRYAHRTTDTFHRDLEDVRREFVDALFRLRPDLSPGDVVESRAFRTPFVEPLWTPGYGNRRPPTALVPDRVFLSTAAHVYPEVTSWNSATRVARETVEAMGRVTVGAP